jgi:hypothetical protein
MPDQPDPRFAEILDRTITPELYAEIRDLWLRHVTNEEKLFVPHSKEVAEAAMQEMLAAFVEDCLVEITFTGECWTGYDGARRFYDVLLSSIVDMTWVPQALVIGPQGVLDVVNMTGMLLKPFAGMTAVNQTVAWQLVIYFPWVPEARRFRGEIIYDLRSLAAHESTSVPFAHG